MKKIFKKIKLRDLVFTITGLIIGGSIGITATTYILQANEIEFKNNKSVQEAIEELYVLSQNSGGSTETLPIGTITAEGYKIIVPYTGSYQNAKCVYGTTESYGNEGTISNNTCTFAGTSSNQKLYFKIVTTTITSSAEGTIYEYSGSATTGASGVTVVKTGLPTGVKAILYLDPTNLGATCNAQNSTSTTGTKSGCMKWYAFKEDSKNYTMILDHNTTAKVGSWSAASTQLTTDTSGWSGSSRLITGQEVADITGISWTSSSCSSGYRFGGAISSNYYWLYDYMSQCTKYGCKVADGSVSGYWTATACNSTNSWVMEYYTFNTYSASASYMGVRPVIIVQKSNL